MPGPDHAETDDLVLDAASGLVRMSFLVQSRYATTATAHDLTPRQAQLLCIVRTSPVRWPSSSRSSTWTSRATRTVHADPADIPTTGGPIP